MIGLTVVIAAATIAYTVVTWESVAAMREGNAIQQQVLTREVQKTDPAPESKAGSKAEAKR
jgi:hypothetical protein